MISYISNQTRWRWLRLTLLFSLAALGSLACTISLGPAPSPTAPVDVLPQAALPSELPIEFTPTPLPTGTPLPPPTATPLPGARVAVGDHALFNGDWDGALAAYQQAWNDAAYTNDQALQAAAQYGIGRTYYLLGDYAAALNTLRDLVERWPDAPQSADASFYLGETFMALDRTLEAVDAYLVYLAKRPGLIDAYVYERRGDALFAAGDYAAAHTDYLAAYNSPHLAISFGLEIKLARTYAITGDYPTAILMYQDMYARAADGYTKAQIDFLLGQTYTANNQVELAYAAYYDAVLYYPYAYGSDHGLVVLVNAGFAVEEYARGLTDYYAGEYSVAIDAFDHSLEAAPTAPGSAHYYKGLCQSALGDSYAAIEQWNIVIQDYPNSALWDEAWEQKAYILWAYLDEYGQARQVLLDFLAVNANHARSAEFLFDAARVAERDGDLAGAAQLWERLAAEYPASEYAYRSLWLAAISYYRQGIYTTSAEAFIRARDLAPNFTERAGVYFWLGKTYQAIGDEKNARQAWEQAAALDPTGYYSERASDVLAGRHFFAPPNQLDLGIDWANERLQAENWLRQTFFLDASVDLSVPGGLAGDPRFVRGQEFWRLGLVRQARQEFESLRESVAQSAVDSYKLAAYFHESGLYRSAILSARQVLTLAGLDDAASLSAPRFFNYIRFGPYFSDLVIPFSQENDFSPLFTWSVMRQESFFEPFIGSSVGARGLMQIMPETGQALAEQYAWPVNFTAADLYRPQVSIRLGLEYLDQQRDYLDEDIYAALAAYNGGPGNAASWQALANGDLDLLLEIIRFDETRTYIKAIYEMYDIYRGLYDRLP